MGGLVIKKVNILLVGQYVDLADLTQVYLLARQDPAYNNIANRIHSLFFLGTPHRGADSAQLLANVVSAAVGQKAYVNDLIPSSGFLQVRNCWK